MVLVCCETKEDGAVEGVAQPTEGWRAKLLMPAVIGFDLKAPSGDGSFGSLRVSKGNVGLVGA